MKSIHLLSVAVFVMAYIYNYDQLANAEIKFLGLQDNKSNKNTRQTTTIRSAFPSSCGPVTPVEIHNCTDYSNI